MFRFYQISAKDIGGIKNELNLILADIDNRLSALERGAVFAPSGTGMMVRK